jgi:hypothetical protein
VNHFRLLVAAGLLALAPASAFAQKAAAPVVLPGGDSKAPQHGQLRPLLPVRRRDGVGHVGDAPNAGGPIRKEGAPKR